MLIQQHQSFDAISFESVLIETELVSPVEIGWFVTDLDVFEHLDKFVCDCCLDFLMLRMSWRISISVVVREYQSF